MRLNARSALLAATAFTAAWVWASIEWPFLAEDVFWYNVVFAGMTVAAVPLWGVLRKRRVASLGMSATGLAATLTGFYLLYWKADLKASGWKDFWKYWHCVTSVAFLLLLVAHYVNNHTRFVDFLRRLARWRPGITGTTGAWALAVLYAGYSWSALGKVRFTEENYLLVSSWALFLTTLAAYAWWLASLRRMNRTRRRALVDANLLGTALLSLGTGFVLLWNKAYLHGNGLKYVSKFWHTWTSIVFLVLVAGHVVANVAPLVAHWRRAKADLKA